MVTVVETAIRPSTRRSWWTVGVLFLLSTVAWMDRSVISMVIGPIKAHFGVSDVQIGLLAGLAFSIFYILFLIPIGWLADRFSRRIILFTGVVVWSLATVVFGLAGSFTVLLASRMMVGAGEGSVSPVAAATITRLFGPARMAAPMSVYSLGTSFGTAIGVLVAGQILALGVHTHGFEAPLLGRLEPWQLVYVVIGLPGLLAALLAFTITDPKADPWSGSAAAAAHSAKRAGQAGLWRFIFRHPGAFGCTVLGFVVVNTAVTSILTWTPEYLHRHFALGPGQIGWIMATISLGAPLLCQAGAGLLANRMMIRGNVAAPLRLMRWLGLAAIPFVAGLWLAPTALIFGVCVFVLLALLLASNPLGAAAVQLISPPHLRASLAAAYLAVLGVVGIGVGASLVPLVAQYGLPNHSLGLSMGVVALLCLVISTSLLLLGEPMVRRLILALDA